MLGQFLPCLNLPSARKSTSMCLMSIHSHKLHRGQAYIYIYIHTYLCMLYATFLLAAGATPLMLMEFFCLFFLGCSARLSFPPHLLEELQRNPGQNVLVVVFRRIGQDVFTSKHSYNVTSQLCMEYTLWTPTYQVSWVAFFG